MTEEVQPHILQQYQLVKKIGSGAYGHVWKVLDRQTKSVKALKKNFDAFSNSTDAQRTYREIMFLRQLKHNNIISLEKVIRAKNDKDIYLVFQHMDIDLHTLIRQNGKTTQLHQKHKQFIIYQIAKSLFYLHHTHLIHRDIKPSNILINESCQAKLCDFGLVRLMEEPPEQELVIMTDYIATRWYRAPQLLLGSKDYNKQVDMWALGCLIGQMFYGKAMFPGTSTVNQIEKVVAWTGQPSNQDLKHLNPNLPQNVLQLLKTRKKVNKSQFFQTKMSPSCIDLISKLLQFNPSKRLTIEEVLKHEYLSEFYQERQIRSIRSSNLKIHLHINDNTKLSLKDYRQLIYNEISIRKKVLTNHNFHSDGHTHSKSKGKKKDMSKEKSKHKISHHTTHNTEYNNKFYTFQSTHSQENRFSRKEMKSSLEKSIKSRPQSRKKGISLCSKSMNKNYSLSKKQCETTDTNELCKNEMKRIKANSRSCSQKYEKVRRMVTQQCPSRKKGVLLNQCFVNQNIGRRYNHQR